MTESPPGSADLTGTDVARSPPADTQPSADERERVVDRASLDDAVQVEHDRLGAKEHPSAQPRAESSDGTPAGDGRAVARQRREVAVVAGGKNGATDGRGDQAAGGARGVECRSKHRRQLLGDERNAKGSSVDRAQLRVLEKAAEAAVALVEERADTVDGGAVGEHDLAPHRAEGGHDPPL